MGFFFVKNGFLTPPNVGQKCYFFYLAPKVKILRPGQITSDMKFLQINAFVLPSYWKCSKKIKNKIKNPTSCVYKEKGHQGRIGLPIPPSSLSKRSGFF